MRDIGLTWIIAALGILLTGCAPSPPPEETSGVEPDPAVLLASEKAGRAGVYREGYLGEGDDLIHYVEAGEGPPILFVHGFPSFWYLWHDQMEAFRHCRRVIAIDAPGANRSARPQAQDYYRLENLANRLDSLIAELSPDEKVTLVGHDWGGALAWSYAERDASRVDRMAIFSAPPHDLLMELLATDPEQRERSGYMERFSSITRADIEARAIHQSMFELAYGEMIKRGVLDAEEGEVFRQATEDVSALDAGMAWYRANIPPFDDIDPEKHSWPAAGASADVPTLLIRGSKDRTFVKKMGELAVSHASSLDVKVIEGVGHWTTFEDPETANRLFGQFIGLPEGCPETAE